MFITDIRKISLTEAIVSTFEEGTGKFLRAWITPSNLAEYSKAFKEVWPDKEPVKIGVYFQVDAASLSQELPGIFQEVTNPVTKKQMTLHGCIMDLNDTQGWSREQIADWIETLDNPPKFGVKHDLPF